MTVNPRGPWQERWQEGRTGWDQGGAHPLLPALLHLASERGGLTRGAHIYEPGCGRAHNAYRLAQLGFQVTAHDFVEEAVAEAQERYQHPRLVIAQGDALAPALEEHGKYDAIFDRAMLCAFEPQYRKNYVAACTKRLKPGGVFMGIPFAMVDKPEDGRPPFKITSLELWELFSEDYTLCASELYEVKGDPSIVTGEILWVARRKDT